MLDLFAGSGQIGLETISRGASHVLCWWSVSKESIQVIRDNVRHCGFGDSTVEIVSMDFSSYLMHKGQKFDLAFLDPPYGQGFYAAKSATCIVGGGSDEPGRNHSV